VEILSKDSQAATHAGLKVRDDGKSNNPTESADHLRPRTDPRAAAGTHSSN